jgi:beta-mannosidase
VNGVRVFCRGANWVPPDSLVGREAPALYRRLLDLAVDSNFNMLRIWGGAGFERDIFFDLCDERGILVWMDFPFACMQYPGDRADFRRLVRLEAEHHVRRLRSRASLAVWCGNNEVNAMLDAYDVRRIPYRDTTRVIFDEILPRVVRRLDPTRPYVPSSPYYGEVAGSPLEGDRHAWGVSIGDVENPAVRDWHSYDGDRAKFASEWGLLSCPELATLRESLGSRGLRVGSPEWKFHQNEFDRGIVERRVRDWVHPRPDSLPLGRYVRATQMCQAEGLQYGIERWRRRKWDCSGSLYWMFNDSWPAATGWTTIDWRLRKKASYYAVRRAYAPVALSLAVRDGMVECWGVNDTLSDLRGTLKLGIMQMTGRAVEEKRLAARIPANSSVMLHSEPLLSWLDPAKEFYWARLEEPGRRGRGSRAPSAVAPMARRLIVAETCRLMDWFRFLLLEPPKLRTKLRSVAGGAVMELTAGNFCRMVELVLPKGVEADDNFFDLYPGKKVAVGLTGDTRAASRVKVTAMNRIARPG